MASSSPRIAGPCIAVVALLLSGTAPAVAQAPNCPEGRTASGACANARLAQQFRLNAIVFTQKKLSFTQHPAISINGNNGTYTTLQDRRLTLEINGPRMAPAAPAMTAPATGGCSGVC